MLFGKSALDPCFLQSLMYNFSSRVGALCRPSDHQHKYVCFHLGKSCEARSLLGLMNWMYPRCFVVSSNVTLK